MCQPRSPSCPEVCQNQQPRDVWAKCPKDGARPRLYLPLYSSQGYLHEQFPRVPHLEEPLSWFNILLSSVSKFLIVSFSLCFLSEVYGTMAHAYKERGPCSSIPTVLVAPFIHSSHHAPRALHSAGPAVGADSPHVTRTSE